MRPSANNNGKISFSFSSRKYCCYTHGGLISYAYLDLTGKARAIKQEEKKKVSIIE